MKFIVRWDNVSFWLPYFCWNKWAAYFITYINNDNNVLKMCMRESFHEATLMNNYGFLCVRQFITFWEKFKHVQLCVKRIQSL
jgi:hypothetical protein